jgi:hypothetical protein
MAFKSSRGNKTKLQTLKHKKQEEDGEEEEED